MVCNIPADITAEKDHWLLLSGKCYIFMANQSLLSSLRAAVTTSLISHSLHFHVWEGETGRGFGSERPKAQNSFGIPFIIILFIIVPH